MDIKKAGTGLLQKLGNNKLVARGIAKAIPKEEFLEGLRENWASAISKNSDTEEEVKKAYDRIKKSGYEGVFKSANITEDDLRQVIESIKNDKPVTFRRTEPKVGRNSPCPCGSGKKYKKCCGKEG